MINGDALWILMDDMSYWYESNMQRQADIVAGGLYIWGAVSLEVWWVLVDLWSHWFGVGGIMIPLVWCWQNCDNGGIVLMEPRRHWYVVDVAVLALVQCWCNWVCSGATHDWCQKMARQNNEYQWVRTNPRLMPKSGKTERKNAYFDVPGWLVEWPNWYSADNSVDVI